MRKDKNTFDLFANHYSGPLDRTEAPLFQFLITDIFSIPHLKSKLRIAKEQMSVPLPAMPVKIPPKNPVMTKTIPCQTPKF
jgi:hypothetical protein